MGRVVDGPWRAEPQPGEWTVEAPYRTITSELLSVERDLYVRVRGTDGSEMEPAVDPRGENPWTDLWFYSNPIFLHVH